MHKVFEHCKDQELIVKVSTGDVYSGKLVYINENYIILTNSVIGKNKHGTEIRGDNIINMSLVVSICEDPWNK